MTQTRPCGMPSKGAVLAFLALTCVSTWLPAWVLQDFWQEAAPTLATDILRCSVLYLALIGWQPLAAAALVRRFLEPARPLDAGLRRASEDFTLPSLLLPCATLLLSSLLYLLVEPQSAMQPTGTSTQPSFGQEVLAVLAVLMASLVIYCQCWLEEIAWRGYFLVRAMECAGSWRGLVLHGAVWGAWYGAILVVLSGGTADSWERAGAFVATCALLGVVFGWLRLAARSVVPAVVANSVFTLGAGLPILLRGGDVGARGAVYLPIGWVPLALLIVWFAFSRYRQAVVTPRPPRRRRLLSTALH